MNILEAAHASAQGHTVISNAGRRYTPDQLAVKWVGAHYASMNGAGMTEAERKGEWKNDARS
ncbi:hypothetical protein MKY59_21700 [Paenibacillus sp. FSL W8-0426]|uniref:hypothetical protein n=1 Tax=Paenibacillus sp. FSL W8-0426 TaxID=2921714 RepID=UPI0030D973B2